MVTFTDEDYSAFQAIAHRALTVKTVNLLSTKELTVTLHNKPEWFVIAENDGRVSPRKMTKGLSLAAIASFAVILGVGTVIGQNQNNLPAYASQTSALTSAPAQSQTVANPATSSQPIQISVKQLVNGSSATTISARVSPLVNPTLANMPTTGGDDDEVSGDDHYEGDDD